MSDDIFSGIKSSLPEDDPQEGHIKRFEKKLNSASEIRSRLQVYQRIAIAASIAAFLLLATILTVKFGELKTHKTVLYSASSELYETELYLTGEINEKMEILTSSGSLDKAVLEDIHEIDQSFEEVRKELIKNPNDDRLISAVIETYRIKLDLLNEILQKKNCENNI